MKLSALRDKALADQVADQEAEKALADAQNSKLQTAGSLATSRKAFGHGLDTVGGRAVDTAASPPVVYTSTPDGFDASPIPDLSGDTPDEAPPETGPVS